MGLTVGRGKRGYRYVIDTACSRKHGSRRVIAEEARVGARTSEMSTKMEIGKVTLGVVGGGQLGRMMAWPCHRMGKYSLC